MRENIAAEADYVDSMNDYYADQDETYYDRARERFFSQHPDLRLDND